MGDVSRRFVLGSGAATLGLAAFGAVAPAASAVSARPAVPDRSHFAAFVGHEFVATRGHRRRRLRLVTVDDLRPSTKAQQPHCFTLIFEPVDGRHLPEAIYHVTRAGSPASELFLSGVGAGLDVQAVINRAR